MPPDLSPEHLSWLATRHGVAAMTEQGERFAKWLVREGKISDWPGERDWLVKEEKEGEWSRK